MIGGAPSSQGHSSSDSAELGDSSAGAAANGSLAAGGCAAGASARGGAGVSSTAGGAGVWVVRCAVGAGAALPGRHRPPRPGGFRLWLVQGRTTKV